MKLREKWDKVGEDASRKMNKQRVGMHIVPSVEMHTLPQSCTVQAVGKETCCDRNL